jgi:hypothetical protein
MWIKKSGGFQQAFGPLGDILDVGRDWLRTYRQNCTDDRLHTSYQSMSVLVIQDYNSKMNYKQQP